MATTRKAPLAEGDLDVEIDDDPVPEVSAVRNLKVRRRGRPANSDGLTSQRILSAARECFAESGYVAASTHMVAARVGLTTGALYHHFGSKRELYLAVFDEVEELVFDRFRAAAARETTFVAKVEAVLDEAVRLSKADPTVAGFLLSVSGDLARHPDLREAVQTAWARRDEFMGEIVDAGIATGELARADRTMVLDMLMTVVGGLVVVGTGLPGVQNRAVKGLKRLLAGTLIVS
jgi:AcrR family transcriptional regulator